MSRSATTDLEAALRSAAPGAVISGTAAAEHDRDFGGIVRRAPGLVLRARSEADVVAGLRACRERGVPAAIRGAGHSCGGQSLIEGGLLLANDLRAATPPSILDGGLVEVSARSRWGAVDAALRARDLSVAGLADCLDLSVGGTLSVGGYGIDSIAEGAQVDQVERLRVVAADGSATWCSADEQVDLFRFALAGLGQAGVIERAVLRTRPARRWSALFTYEHGGLSEMADSFAWMTAGDHPAPALFKALHSRGRFVSTYGAAAPTLAQALSARPPAGLSGRSPRRRLIVPFHRLLRSWTVSAWVARFPGRRRLWHDYLLDHAGLVAFARVVEDLLASGAYAGCLPAIYFLGIRRPPRKVAFPLEASEGGSPLKFLVGLYAMIPAGDAEALEHVRLAARACLSACVELGGRPYLYGWHQLDPPLARRLYGTACDDLVELRRLRDPDGLFQAGRLPTA